MRAELLKLRFSRSIRTVGTGVVVLFALINALILALPSAIDGLVSLNRVIPNATKADRMSPEQLEMFSFRSIGAQWQIADIAGSSSGLLSWTAFVTSAIAAFAITSEYRHGSISMTVVLARSRLRLVGEKLVVIGVVITLIMGLFALVSSISLLCGTGLFNTSLLMTPGDLAGLWLGSWLVSLLTGWPGFGLGLILRHQVLSLFVLLAMAAVESVLRPISMLVFGRASWLSALPFGLAGDVSRRTNMLGMTNVAGFAPGPALFLLTMWCVGVVSCATVLFVRRDVSDSK